MSDVNLCIFIGRLGQDPDVRYQANGDAITSFSIAVGSQWKSKSGEKQESTEWVSCTAFGKLAGICGEYLKKGSQVFISGRMKTDKYQAKDGTDRYSTKIIVNEMTMLGGKSDAQVDAKPKADVPVKPPLAAVGTNFGKTGFDDFEDSIPF